MGTLAKVSVQNKEYEEGFISFLRLVGVVYMKKHISGFNGKTPEAYFNGFFKQGQFISKQHLHWLDDIRQCIWDCIQFENEMIPSVESLFRHWKRVCWVLDLWKQSDKNIMCPKPLSEYGWITTKDTLAIDWDSQSNMDEVRERVAGLLKGCACKTGCLTQQCRCQKRQGLWRGMRLHELCKHKY